VAFLFCGLPVSFPAPAAPFHRPANPFYRQCPAIRRNPIGRLPQRDYLSVMIINLFQTFN
jgi:hypothetical protein